MALPQPVYDKEDDKPVTGPNLRNLESGGSSSGGTSHNVVSSVGDKPSSSGNTTKGSISSTLKSAEQAASSFINGASNSQNSGNSDANTNVSDVIGGGFNATTSATGIGRFVTRKRAIGGGVAAAAIVGVVGLFSIASGPLQFIHIAQLLSRFHFQSLEDSGDSRTMAFYRFSKNYNTGTLENTRLGIVGSRVAQSIDGKLSDIGIQKNFSKGFTAQYEGVTVDQDKFSANARNGENFRDLSREDFKARFLEKYNVQLTDAPDGTLVATTEDIGGYFKNRSFNGVLIEEAGIGKIPGSAATRIMGVRDGVTWHPIKKLDAKITGSIDEQFTAWLEKTKQRIRKGETEALTATGDTNAKDQNGKTDQNKVKDNQDGADKTNDFAKDAKDITNSADNIDADIPPATTDEVGAGAISKLTESTAGRVGLGTTAVVGLACAARGIAQAADGLKHDLVVLPLVRTGVQAISLGNQVMNGKDVNLTQLSFYNKQLTDAKGQSWSSARSIQAEQGQALTGPDIPEAASISKIQEGNLFTQFIDGIPGLGGICSVANSTVGSLAMTIVGVVTAPVATIGQEIVVRSGALNDAIGSIVRWVAGSPIPAVVAGPDYGNYINFGARLAANDSFAALGGTALSTLQSTEMRQYENQVQQDRLSKQSFAQRMFNPYSPDSLVAKAIDGKPASSNQYMTSIASTFTNPGKFFGSLLTPFSRRALAADTYDYGFPEVGFSLEDLNSNDYADPFANAQKATEILKGPSGESFINRAKACFGVTLTTDGNVTSSTESLDVTKKDFYSNSNNCADANSDWKRLRFLILDTKIAEAADCYNSGDTQSCTDIGFGATGASSKVAISGNATSIVELARLFSWPEKWPPADRASEPGRTGPLSPKQEYAAALLQYNKGAPYHGADCGAFVATVMRASGADPTYPLSSTVAQEDYVRGHPEKYNVLPTVASVNDLQPGDILIVNKGRSAGALGHTYIFVGGTDPRKNQASASGGDRMPNLGGAEVVDSLGRGNYLVARLK